jgi:D-alanine-D-alanine ligase
VRVLILHDELAPDARPDELDTLVQVRAVRAALASRGLECETLAFGTDLAASAGALRAAAPDVVFNLVESVAHEGRLIHVAPALLEALGLPFTGPGSEAMLLTASKLATKRVLVRAGLPTPAWHTLDELRAGVALEGPRWLLKSVWEHGSLGLEPGSVVAPRDAEELADELAERLDELGGEAFAEAYVHGRELNVALLGGPRGPEVLPIPEILFEALAPDEPRVVGYRAKWAVGSAEYAGTPRRFPTAARDRALLARLRSLALATWEACGLAGAARVDFRVDAEARPFVIDVNANACLSPDAGYAATLAHADRDYADALVTLVEAALARGATRRSPHARGGGT